MRPKPFQSLTTAEMSRNKRSTASRTVSVTLTLLAAVAFFWAATEWLERNPWSPTGDRVDVFMNESTVYPNLMTIAEAQERFRQVDWNGDGEKTYALFLVHLWRTVDANVEPVEVNLIPKRLGFAMERSLATGGYYYRDLHKRELPPEAKSAKVWSEARNNSDKSRPIDPTLEWYMAAVPKIYRRTGVHTFIVDGSGRIYAKDLDGRIISMYPYSPAHIGWKLIQTRKDLEDLTRLTYETSGLDFP
ncbi:MAG: DUF2950 family protein [Deltaproteobacteria bacterium]|nr:MAG: DUF2950 family protein [Deltaproteobacteria bacterium]